MNYFLKIIFSFIILNTVSIAQTHITTDTEWTTDQILTGAVIVDAGATLTIAAGVLVQTFFVDTDADGIGNVEIEVLGGLKINGTPSNPVLFKPYETTTNKNYWTGIVINSSISNDSLNFFKVYNANTGIDISSPVTITGGTVRNSGGTGINVNTVSDGNVSLNDITVKHSDGDGVITNSPNMFMNWVLVDSCNGNGLFINEFGVVDLRNSTISNSGTNGIYILDGDITVLNSIISNNIEDGIKNSSGNLDVSTTDIINNGLYGVIIGGAGSNSINLSTLSNNTCAGIEITEYKLDYTDVYADPANSAWTWISQFAEEAEPTFEIQNSNLMNNGRNPIEDPTNYNIFGYNTPQNKEIPFGNFIKRVSYRQPATDHNSNQSYYKLCSGTNYNPDNLLWSSQGAHSSEWVDIIHNTSDDLYWVYASGSGGTEYFHHHKQKFQLGKNEIFSNLNTSYIIDATLNYWGQLSSIDTLIFSRVAGTINYTNFQVFEVADAHSTVDETGAIALTSPVAAASYETATSVALIWTSSGWAPVVNIAISTDLGSTWNYLVEGIANTGSYSWWNDLAVGTTVYLKIEDSYNSSVSSQVGPFFIIENSTPIVGVSSTVVDFDSTLSSLTFNIMNNGGGTLNWTATDDQDWLSLSSASGSTSDQTGVTVTVNRIGMNPGDYTGTISITSDGGNATISVSMTVAQPVMSISPTSLDFESTLVELPFYISNTGGGSFTWTATPSTNWLAVNPASGTTMTQDAVLVTVDRSLTTSGVHTGLIIFSSSVGNTSISISMSDIGDPPVAETQTVITDEDTPVSITLTGTDTDGDDLTYFVITNPTIGALSGTAPNLTYTPNTDVYGSDSLTFKVNDGTFDSSPATVTIVINSTNDGPSITLPDDFTFAEDGSLVVDFTPYVGDVDGDALSLSVSNNSEITVAIADYEVTFGATDNWNGTETLIFIVDDSQGRAVAADSLNVVVTSVNDSPVADAGSDSTYESPFPYGPVDVTLDGNGSNDIDGNIVSYIWTESGTQVADVVSPTLTLALGNYTFTLSVTDNEGGTDSDDAIINVIELPNTAPVADDQTAITDEEVPLAITLTASDSENDPLTFSVVTNPSNGTLSGTAPNLTYSPNADYAGVDIFTFMANDGVFDSDIATVTITVTPFNDPPTMSEINDVTIDEDNSTQPISFTLTDVDTDLEWILLTGVSSNNDLVDDADIVFDGEEENRTVTITPLPNVFGSATITIIADDEPTADFNVTIHTDAYPNETTWSLFDNTSTIIESEGPLSQSNYTYEWDYNINAGVYTFVIYDTYGDGICCTYGDGYYTISVNDIEIGSGAEFGNSESTTFSTNTGTFRIERVSFTNPLPYEKGMEILFPNGIEQLLSPPVVIFEQTIPENDRDTSSVSFTLTVNSVNDPPAAFSLSNPSNNYTLEIDENNLNDDFSFSWGNTGDVDGDDLIYELVASGDLQFLNTSNIENTNSVSWLVSDILGAIGNGTVVTDSWDVIKSDGTESVESSNGPRTLTIDASALSIKEELIPNVFALHQNYPNPFNPITTLRYDLPENSYVNVTIYDMLGREIRTLVNSTQDAGFKSVIWDATNNQGNPVSAGVYLYQINADGFVRMKKMVLLK